MTWTTQRVLVAAVVIAVAVSAGFVAAQAVGSSGGGGGSGTMTLDLYAARTHIDETASDANVAWDLYALDDPGSTAAPGGDPIGRMLARCAVITSSEGFCQGFINLDGRGTLAVYKLGLTSGFTATAVIPGTGEFVGARGTLDVSVASDDSINRIYHFELTGLGSS